ncbi:calreticulin isoform X4 [Cryptomeria japonica]|uniref:calreticulin isoform X4 n=1 Tax=Cryptomeria japonica TaxID=3369 RepID=UPI0027DA1794|nr:calreticulin isoform X4 [Cryptomeria japonica]
MESLQQECIIEEVTEDGTSDSPAPAKSSSKDSKKANGAHAVAVKSVTLFDNILVFDDPEYGKKLAEEIWGKKQRCESIL